MNAHPIRWELLAGPVLCSLTLWLTRRFGPAATPGQRAFNGCYLLLAGYFLPWSDGKGPFLLNAVAVVLPLLCLRLSHRLRQGAALATGPAWLSGQNSSQPDLGCVPPAGHTRQCKGKLLVQQADGHRTEQLCTPRKSAVQRAAHCLRLSLN